MEPSRPATAPPHELDTVPEPRFCLACGDPAQDGQRFCSTCGIRLTG